jgi:phosphoglucosamine mutase
VAPQVFAELGAQITVIGAEPDGLNINLDCGSTHPQRLQAEVRRVGADLGIAFDGDGDRVIMVDGKGAELDGDELLFIIARHRVQTGRFAGGVAGTLMTNLGLEHAFAGMRVPFIRTRVGDRYILEALKQRGWMLGGEGSGHIVCLDLNTTGDGIVSSLQVLAAMVQGDTSLAALRAGMDKLPQTLVNVTAAYPAAVVNSEGVARAVRLIEQSLGAAGRVLLRPSGTEPVVRVMVEGGDAQLVARLAEELAHTVRAAAAAG